MMDTQAASAVGGDNNGTSPSSNVTFATNLLFNLDAVSTNCAAVLIAHANLIHMLQGRINLERTYAQELSKIACFSPQNDIEYGSMKTAMASLKAQYLNTSMQHQQLASNLEEDVLKPIKSLYEINREKSKRASRWLASAKKDVKIHEDAYRKDLSVFEERFRGASTSFSDAVASGYSNTLLEDRYYKRLSQIDVEESLDKMHSLDATIAYSAKRSRTDPLKTINSNKLVSWLLSSEIHRKEDLAKNTVNLMKAAEKARRKCQHSWQVVETHCIQMYRVVQAVLADYQQIAEDYIATITTSLRKHVVVASSTLANEQYDWQVTALKFENVNVKRDIHEFVRAMSRNKDLLGLTVSDVCNNVAFALIRSPYSKPCKPLRKTCVEVCDIWSKKVPFDDVGNQELLSKVLEANQNET